MPRNKEAGVYRPLSSYTFAVNYLLFGESPVSFHIINIVLNSVVVFLVFVLIYQLFKNLTLAYLTALLFAVLPIHTEVVASIKSRDEILPAMFFLTSWLIYNRGVLGQQRHSNWWILISAFLFFLAVLSKETIFLAAPWLFLLVAWLQKKLDMRITLRTVGIYLPVLAGYMLLRWYVLGKSAFGSDELYFIINPIREADFWVRIMTACKMMYLYVQKTLVPVNLSASYAYNHLTLVTHPFSSWEYIVGVLILVSLVAVLCIPKLRRTPIPIGAAIFLFSYSMISKFLFTGGEIFAERWMYVPSIGIALIMAYGFVLLSKYKKNVAILVLVLLIASYGVITVSRNQIWLTKKSFAEGMLKDAPDSVQSYVLMAENFVREKRDFAGALFYIERGMQIYENHPPLLDLYALVMLQRRDYTQAEDVILRSMLATPKVQLSTLILYASILAKQGRYQESINVLTKDRFALIVSSDRKKSVIIIRDKRFSGDMRGEKETIQYLLSVNYYKMGDMQSVNKYFDWGSTLNRAQKINVLKEF